MVNFFASRNYHNRFLWDSMSVCVIVCHFISHTCLVHQFLVQFHGTKLWNLKMNIRDLVLEGWSKPRVRLPLPDKMGGKHNRPSKIGFLIQASPLTVTLVTVTPVLVLGHFSLSFWRLNKLPYQSAWFRALFLGILKDAHNAKSKCLFLLSL